MTSAKIMSWMMSSLMTLINRVVGIFYGSPRDVKVVHHYHDQTCLSATMITPVIEADNKPVNLPGPEEIIRIANSNSKSNDLPGIPLVDESSGATPYARIRCGTRVTMGEALTQQFVGQALNGKADTAVRVPCIYLAFQVGFWGYIVTEHIDGSICDSSDAALITTAVESLITVRGPTAVPGPIGGGLIRHYFFNEEESPITYDSVQELEDHINGVSVPLCSALSLAGFWMMNLEKDSRIHEEAAACQLRARGRGLRSAPLPL